MAYETILDTKVVRSEYIAHSINLDIKDRYSSSSITF